MTLVYLAVAWAVGIWLSRWLWSLGVFGCAAPAAWLWAGALAAPLAGLAVARQQPRWRLPAVLLLFLVLGALRFQLTPFTPCFTPDDLAYYNGTLDDPAWATVTGVVLRPPEERDTRLRVRVQAESVTLGQDEEPLPVSGRRPVHHRPLPGLRYGDRVAVRGRLEAPPVFEDFDYREYLARQRRPHHGPAAGGHACWATATANGSGRRCIARARSRRRMSSPACCPSRRPGLLTGILLGVETRHRPGAVRRVQPHRRQPHHRHQLDSTSPSSPA